MKTIISQKLINVLKNKILKLTFKLGKHII